MYQEAFKSKAYLAELAMRQAEYEQLKEQYDIVLDPIELPAKVAAKGLAEAGNWANDFLFENLVPEVLARAAGKVHIAIVDTGWKPLNDYILPYVDVTRCTNHIPSEPGGDDHGHAHLCTGNLVGDHPTTKLGVVRELAKAGLVVVTLHKGLNRQGAGTEATLVAAVRAANAVNIPGTRKIVSMSFGGSSFLPALAAVIAEGQAQGIIYSASAGNSGGTGTPSTVGVPARLPKVFNWGALKSDGTRDYYSSAGPELYAIAPGSGVLSTNNTKTGLVAWSGTSSSNPVGVGLLACLLVMNPNLTYEALDAMVRAKIADAGAPGKDVLYGHGIPYLRPYLESAPPPPPPPPPATYDKRLLEVNTVVGAGFPWRRLKDTETQIASLVSIRYQWTSTKPAAEWAALQSRIVAYLNAVGIIIPDEWDVDQAIMWLGRFVQREIAKEYPGLQVLEVQGGVEADKVLFRFGAEYYATQTRVMRQNDWPVAVWKAI